MFRSWRLALIKSITRPYKLYNISLYSYSLINLGQLKTVDSYCERFLLRFSCSLKVRLFPRQLRFVRSSYSCSINSDHWTDRKWYFSPITCMIKGILGWFESSILMVWSFSHSLTGEKDVELINAMVRESWKIKMYMCFDHCCYRRLITELWRNKFGMSRSNIVPENVGNAH